MTGAWRRRWWTRTIAPAQAREAATAARKLLLAPPTGHQAREARRCGQRARRHEVIHGPQREPRSAVMASRFLSEGPDRHARVPWFTTARECAETAVVLRRPRVMHAELTTTCTFKQRDWPTSPCVVLLHNHRGPNVCDELRDTKTYAIVSEMVRFLSPPPLPNSSGQPSSADDGRAFDAPRCGWQTGAQKKEAFSTRLLERLTRSPLMKWTEVGLFAILATSRPSPAFGMPFLRIPIVESSYDIIRIRVSIYVVQSHISGWTRR